MGKKQPLPFARLGAHFAECLRCGYPLEGIPAPGVCPECGLEFADGASTLVLAGVARSGSSGPAWRRWAWAGVGLLGFVTLQGVALFVLFAPWLGVLLFVSFVLGVMAMLITTRQKQKGVEYFVLSHAGLSRWTLGSDPTTRDFEAWAGDQRSVRIQRVSRVWASISIVCASGDSRARKVLVGGFRCREADVAVVERVAMAMVLGQAIDAVVGLEGSTLLDGHEDSGAGCV